MNFPKSINIEKFIAYMRELRQNYKNEKIAIFLDRLSVHRSIRVRDAANDLGLKIILNASYSPNFNPIEGAIGIIKNIIKTKRLN